MAKKKDKKASGKKRHLKAEKSPKVLNEVFGIASKIWNYEIMLNDRGPDKLIAEPHEYVSFPPTLKLFYRFLHEKGYIADPENVNLVIDTLGPNFILDDLMCGYRIRNAKP
jgi:hypothetical protein